MNKTILTLGVVFACALFLTNAATAAGIKEGKWSLTTTIHIAGMDDQAGEAMKEMENMSPEEKAMMQQMMGGMGISANAGGMTTTMPQCITNDNPVPEASNNPDCQSTHNTRGNTVSFEVVCPDSTSRGQVSYNNETMNGTITSKQTNGQEAKIDISGKYIGPCDSAASTEGLSKKELALREKELELKQRELDLQEKQMNQQTAKTKKPSKSALENVNSGVNTANSAKSTFNGLRSLLGR